MRYAGKVSKSWLALALTAGLFFFKGVGGVYGLLLYCTGAYLRFSWEMFTFFLFLGMNNYVCASCWF